MCVAIPALIISIEGNSGQIDVGGARRKVGLDFVPEAKVGDYVLVHAGFAISILDADEAEETLRLFRELDEFAATQGEEAP